MDCQSARDLFLDSLLEPLPEPGRVSLDGHLSTCPECRQFVAVQRLLDSHLAHAVPAESLGPWFRPALKARISRESESPWPAWLPDVAHVSGCALTTVVMVTVLPQHTREVLLGGAAFTAITWFLQAVLRAPLEASE